MVDAVLGFARVDSRGGKFGPVELGAVLEQVKSELWKEITVAKAEVTSDALPTIVADEAQIEQLLQNLLSNALKFSGSPPVDVHVSAEESDTEWIISVKDNGEPGTAPPPDAARLSVDRHSGKRPPPAAYFTSRQMLSSTRRFSAVRPPGPLGANGRSSP